MVEVGHALAVVVGLSLAGLQDPPAVPPKKAPREQVPAAASAALKPPPSRTALAGLRGFESRSRIEYLAQPGRPHELRTVYVFPARVRWWISAGEGPNEERRMRYQSGEHVLAVEPRQAASIEYHSEDRDALLAVFELRRALFLWPDDRTWDGQGDERTAPAAVGGRIHAKLAGEPLRPVDLTLFGVDGKPRDSFRRITWREPAPPTPAAGEPVPATRGRAWPASFETWNASAQIWNETVDAVDVETRYIDSFFVPPDRRGVTGAGPGDARDLDIPPTCVRRVPLPAGASWDAARAERTRLIAQVQAAGGPPFEEWATVELTRDGKPAAVILRLARVPDVIPPGFVVVPERPGTASSVSGLARVQPALLESLRARLPADSTPGAAYARFDSRKADPDVVVVVPLD